MGEEKKFCIGAEDATEKGHGEKKVFFSRGQIFALVQCGPT